MFSRQCDSTTALSIRKVRFRICDCRIVRDGTIAADELSLSRRRDLPCGTGNIVLTVPTPGAPVIHEAPRVALCARSRLQSFEVDSCSNREFFARIDTIFLRLRQTTTIDAMDWVSALFKRRRYILTTVCAAYIMVLAVLSSTDVLRMSDPGSGGGNDILPRPTPAFLGYWERRQYQHSKLAPKPTHNTVARTIRAGTTTLYS